MFCKECGNELEEGAKFCPKCGTNQEPNTSIAHLKSNATLSSNDNNVNIDSEENIFIFECSHNYGTGTVTQITTCGFDLTITQYKYYAIIKYGKKYDKINIKNIKSITPEKRLSIGSIIELFFMILATFLCIATMGTIGFLGFLVCIYQLFHMKDNYLVIFHKHGLLRIRENTGYNSEKTATFLDYVRQRNPDAVQIII